MLSLHRLCTDCSDPFNNIDIADVFCFIRGFDLNSPYWKYCIISKEN